MNNDLAHTVASAYAERVQKREISIVSDIFYRKNPDSIDIYTVLNTPRAERMPMMGTPAARDYHFLGEVREGIRRQFRYPINFHQLSEPDTGEEGIKRLTEGATKLAA